MPIFGYTFLDVTVNPAIFGPIGLKIFKVTTKAIICRLMMINPNCYAYFSCLIFWDNSGGKMGLDTTRALYGLRPLNPATWWTFWATFPNFLGLTR